MRKLITVLLTAMLVASLLALPCSAKTSKRKEPKKPKKTTATTSARLTSPDGGPMVEYKGDGFRIQFDIGETKAPFLDGDKREVIKIVSSVQPGRMSEEENKMFTDIARANGMPDLASARIYPIHFEGHIKLDRNIRVHIDIPYGELDGGYDVNLFCIKEDGTVEYLKDAELEVFANGNTGYIERIAFITNEFSTSTYFTARKECDLSKYLDEGSVEASKAEMTTATTTAQVTTMTDGTSSDVTTVEDKPSGGGSIPMAAVVAAALGGVAIGVFATVAIMKRKKT